MKIVTWNCNGAFRKKFGNISIFDADIYVIQECENPEESKHIAYQEWAKNYLWIGDNKSKGLAIFAKPEIELTKLDWANKFKDHTVKHFLPSKINKDFNLLAVWTHRNNSPNFGYIGQFWKYLQTNKDKFEDIILAGDFNSNTIWDEWDRWWNHSDVVIELKDLGIESFYHRYNREEQGNETSPTLFFQKNHERSYHIDYIFGSQRFAENLKDIEVGQMKDWLEISDHMPIICHIDNGIIRDI